MYGRMGVSGLPLDKLVGCYRFVGLHSEALLVSEKGTCLDKQSKKTWNVSPLCLMGCILGERNMCESVEGSWLL